MVERIYLECHDEEHNKHRFYQLFVMRGLLGEWALVREWGRVGSPGTVRKDWFDSVEEADLARQTITQQKIKKGYMRVL
jgi:predicted DNA-binding WGR domain protein